MYGEPDGAWLGVATLHPDCLGDFGGKVSVVTAQALVQAVVQRCSNAPGV
jgi:hypothetical protein